MIITSTGLFDTGSSALHVLLKEYENCSGGVFEDLDNEHLLLYAPDGLFDLEDKLLRGNNIHRSDEAIRRFVERMEWLYVNNFQWFGNYRRLFGDAFRQAVSRFVEQLTEVKLSADWYYDYLGTSFSAKRTAKNMCRKLLHKPIAGDFFRTIRFREDKTVRYSWITPEKFYAAARTFIGEVVAMMDAEKKEHLILDHFLLPHNLFRLPMYFDKDEIRAVTVERDPRDVYVHLMQEVTDHQYVKSIPTDVTDFVTFWRGTRSTVAPYPAEYVLDIQFEDLIYRHDDTVSKVEGFLGLSPDQRTRRGQCFSVEGSRRNTQLFRTDTRWAPEVTYIEEKLPEYLYDFGNEVI
jgi:hypothetical protein